MIEWDFDGNGTVDASGPTVFSTEHTYETAGLFLPTVVVTRRDGTRVVVQSAVTVFSPGLLDTLLQNKFSTMTTALLQQDMEATLRVFALATRDTYRHTFSTLGANVPQWVANIRSLRLVEIRGRMAIYELTGLLNGVERSFSVTFIIDGDGIWRIRFI